MIQCHVSDFSVLRPGGGGDGGCPCVRVPLYLGIAPGCIICSGLLVGDGIGIGSVLPKYLLCDAGVEVLVISLLNDSDDSVFAPERFGSYLWNLRWLIGDCCR